MPNHFSLASVYFFFRTDTSAYILSCVFLSFSFVRTPAPDKEKARGGFGRFAHPFGPDVMPNVTFLFCDERSFWVFFPRPLAARQARFSCAPYRSVARALFFSDQLPFVVVVVAKKKKKERKPHRVTFLC
nr:hypothetical protein [Pandoravirus massiliensis]